MAQKPLLSRRRAIKYYSRFVPLSIKRIFEQNDGDGGYLTKERCVAGCCLVLLLTVAYFSFGSIGESQFAIQTHPLADKITIAVFSDGKGNLDPLLESISLHYPGLGVLIASPSTQQFDNANFKLLHSPFGCSRSRNWLLATVKTPHVFFVQDDVVFSNSTTLQQVLSLLKMADIVAPMQDGEYGTAHLSDQLLVRCPLTSYEQHGPCSAVDYVGNTFGAKTASLREIGFDSNAMDCGNGFLLAAKPRIKVLACSNIAVAQVKTPQEAPKDTAECQPLAVRAFKEQRAVTPPPVEPSLTILLRDTGRGVREALESIRALHARVPVIVARQSASESPLEGFDLHEAVLPSGSRFLELLAFIATPYTAVISSRVLLYNGTDLSAMVRLLHETSSADAVVGMCEFCPDKRSIDDFSVLRTDVWKRPNTLSTVFSLSAVVARMPGDRTPLQLSLEKQRVWGANPFASPWSADGQLLLAVERDSDTEVRVGFYNVTADFAWTTVASSRYWSAGNGCFLQWFGGKTSDEILFTTMDRRQPVSEVWSIGKREIVRSFPHLIVHVNSEATLGLSFEYPAANRVYMVSLVEHTLNGDHLLRSEVVDLEIEVGCDSARFGVPVWHPEGKSFLVTAVCVDARGNSDVARLFLYSIGSGSVKLDLPGNHSAPYISFRGSDGRALVGGNDADHLAPFLLYSKSNFPHGVLPRVLKTSIAMEYSKSGSWIVCHRLNGGKSSLVLVDAVSQKVVELQTLSSPRQARPRFSPDGNGVVFEGKEGGLSYIFVGDILGAPGRSPLCTPRNPHQWDLVIGILTRGSARSRRDVIRSTYMDGIAAPCRVKHKFILSSRSVTAEQRPVLEAEEEEFGDLVWLDVPDHYQKLIYKTHGMVKWFNKHEDFAFLLKTDDDSYVVTADMLAELSKHDFNDPMHFGHIFFRSPVQLDPSNVASNLQYHEDTNAVVYPAFASGSGYAFTHDVVKFLSLEILPFRMWRREDASMGSWLAAMDIKRVHQKRWAYNRAYCRDDALLQHKLDPGLMKRVHLSVIQGITFCEFVHPK